MVGLLQGVSGVGLPIFKCSKGLLRFESRPVDMNAVASGLTPRKASGVEKWLSPVPRSSLKLSIAAMGASDEDGREDEVLFVDVVSEETFCRAEPLVTEPRESGCGSLA